MTIESNDPTQDYKLFYGKYLEQMPKLLIEGRIPLSFKDVMQRRLEAANSQYPNLIEAWLDNYFDTGDACVIDSRGNLKVVHDSKHLRGLTPKTELKDGALYLPSGEYDRLDCEEFSPATLKKHGVEDSLIEKQVNEHPVWKALARGDEALLKAYSQMIFAKVKEKFHYDKNMGIYLPLAQEMPQLRSWFANRLDYRSVANGRSGLGNDYGRLVGVAKNLESKIQKRDT